VLVAPDLSTKFEDSTAQGFIEPMLSRFKVVKLAFCPQKELNRHNLHEQNSLCARRISGIPCEVNHLKCLDARKHFQK
jgi:hypothetical protein